MLFGIVINGEEKIAVKEASNVVQRFPDKSKPSAPIEIPGSSSYLKRLNGPHPPSSPWQFDWLVGISPPE